MLTIRSIFQAVIYPKLPTMHLFGTLCMTKSVTKNHILKSLKCYKVKPHGLLQEYSATSIPALNIETYLIPMHHILDKLVIKLTLRIAEMPLYNLFLSIRGKQKNRRATPLETLIKRYKARSGVFADQLEEKFPYIVPPWQKSPYTFIKSSKNNAKIHHQQIIQSQNLLKDTLFYTDGNGINGQIGAAFVLPTWNLTICVYLGEAHLFTVYFGELVGILLVLQTAKDYLWLKTRIVIFTDNQAFIQAIINLGNQSGQFILVNIIAAIDALRDQEKEVELHWIPAH